MDSFDIKAEKANAIKKHRERQKTWSFFRLLEVCLVLVLISKFPLHLPISVKFSSDCFKDLSLALVSPRFVFLLGNVIVLILFAKSSHFSKTSSSKPDFYKEFLKRSDPSRQGIYRDENREKQSTLEDESIAIGETHNCTLEFCQYRRSQSEKSRTANPDNSYKELRRTVTGNGEGLAKKSYPEDDMSNEEFRQTVEAFIARKQRFIREEEHCVL